MGKKLRNEETLVVVAQSGGDRCPIWSIHPIGGSVLWIRHLAANLPVDQPLYGIQARGLDGQQQPHSSVPEMAAHYVRLIRKKQPKGPYRLTGASFGGLVAVEIAHQLRSAGEAIDLLALFDTFGPDYPARKPLGQRLLGLFGRMRGLSWRDQVSLVLGQFRAQFSESLTSGMEDVSGSSMVTAVNRVIAANIRAMELYHPPSYDGSIVLFRATQRPAEFGDGFTEPTNGWSSVAPGRVEVIPINADHRFLLDAPGVHELSRKFSARASTPGYLEGSAMSLPSPC
ncbi:MAG: hypothetical protein JKY37_13285 [Nannocystaceae bacterium]|nr:hypothetical protein [Nannocystaceae bacterium]